MSRCAAAWQGRLDASRSGGAPNAPKVLLPRDVFQRAGSPWVLTCAPLGRGMAGARPPGVVGPTVTAPGPEEWAGFGLRLGCRRRNEINIKIRIRIKIMIKINGKTTIRIGIWRKIRARPVYTSVRMLEGPRNIATFCHFFDGIDDCFGCSGCSASSMGIIEWEQSEGVLRQWQNHLARATKNCQNKSMVLFTMFLTRFFTALERAFAPAGARGLPWAQAPSALCGGTFPTRADESLRRAKGDNGVVRESRFSTINLELNSDFSCVTLNSFWHNGFWLVRARSNFLRHT